MLAQYAPGVLGPGSTEGEILRKRDLTIDEGAGTLTLGPVRSLVRAPPVGQRCRGRGNSEPEVGSRSTSMCVIHCGDSIPAWREV
jgi:hypothetical protein